jgi:hypothetical protein
MITLSVITDHSVGKSATNYRKYEPGKFVAFFLRSLLKNPCGKILPSDLSRWKHVRNDPRIARISRMLIIPQGCQDLGHGSHLTSPSTRAKIASFPARDQTACRS